MTDKTPAIRVRALIAAALLMYAGAAMANALPTDDVRSGTLFFDTPDGYRVATTLDTDVDMAVNGLIARVAVRQRFENTGSEWREAVYVFPLPEKAAVDRMRLRVGERVIESEIRERAEAEKAYEQAKADGRKASLVESERPNLFTTSVANIAPGETVTVEIEYLEDVDYSDGTFSLRFPLTLTPRYVPGAGEVPDASRVSPPVVKASDSHRVSISIALNAGLRLDRITSRYHAIDVRESGYSYDVRLASARVPMDRDFELVWAPVPSAAPRAMRFSESIDGVAHHLLMVMPPSLRSSGPVPAPREIIIVVDTSGSMHGDSIAQAKSAVSRALDGLKPGDRFNLIEFASHARALYPRSADVAPDTLADARRFVAGFDASGGTEMRGALELALANAPSATHLRQVVFITDGAVGNEDALFSLIEARLGSARLFTVGIGSAPNGWFMRKAAEAGRGSFVLIGSTNEVGGEIERLFARIETPQVTDIAIDWPAGVDVDAYPAVVPDLYLDQPVTVKARLRGPLPDDASVVVRGNVPAGAWTERVPLTTDADATESAGVGALWARARIGELMDEVRRSRSPAIARDALVETALGYRIVTRYTSLVAVDRTPARASGAVPHTDAVPSLLPHGQSMHAIFGFPATATAAPAMRLAGLALIFVALGGLFVLRHRGFLHVAAR